MRKIIGNEISVFLKTSEGDLPDISGLLIDVTEENLFVRGDVHDPRVYIIPRDNVNYCTTDHMPSADRAIKTYTPPQQVQHPEPVVQSQQPSILNVYINQEQCASIPVPPTFDLSTWHDGIMRVVMGNPDIKAFLAGKVQSSLEYYPGEVYITIEGGNSAPEQEVHPRPPNSPNTFSMSGGDVTTEFVNPSQMVTRLQNVANRGKKNVDNETEMQTVREGDQGCD